MPYYLLTAGGGAPPPPPATDFWFPASAAEGVTSASSTRAAAVATADAVPHTKGPWMEIVAATTNEVNLITLCFPVATFLAATDTSTLLDIGIGAGGAEVVKVPNLAVGYHNVYDQIDIPITIPSGSRIAIRCQSVVVSKTVSVVMTLAKFTVGRLPSAYVIPFGADIATSRGVGLAVPGVVNTKGAWTEITAATAEPFGGLVVCEQGNADASFAAGTGLLDVATGAAGSEVVIPGMGDLSYACTLNESWTAHGTRLYPATIPSGTRLSARYQATSLSNSMDLSLYGIPAP